MLSDRVPEHDEGLTRLRDLRILLDGASSAGQGLLLQIFSDTVIGPIFFEIIQRKGNEGFGEGILPRLFESIERDQLRRGVLHEVPPSEKPDSQSRTMPLASLPLVSLPAVSLALCGRRLSHTFWCGTARRRDCRGLQRAKRATEFARRRHALGGVHPVYSRMLEEGRERQAGRYAGAIFGMLLAVTAGVVLLGLLLAKPIVAALTPGFLDTVQVAAGQLAINRFDLAVQGVRILFPDDRHPGALGLGLAILNSHRRFFLPYTHGLLEYSDHCGAVRHGCLPHTESGRLAHLKSLSPTALNQLLQAVFYGALLGGALQFIVQLPLVYRLI